MEQFRPQEGVDFNTRDEAPEPSLSQIFAEEVRGYFFAQSQLSLDALKETLTQAIGGETAAEFHAEGKRCRERYVALSRLLKQISDQCGLRPASIIDAGCGSGLLSRELTGTFPDAQIHGFDTSKDMIALARQEFADTPVRFSTGDIFKLLGYWEVSRRMS